MGRIRTQVDTKSELAWVRWWRDRVEEMGIEPRIKPGGPMFGPRDENHPV